MQKSAPSQVNNMHRCVIVMPVIIGRMCECCSKNVGIEMDTFDDANEEDKKLVVLRRRLARRKKIFSCACCQAEVVVFSRTVHPRERFFMKKHGKLVPFGNSVHQIHQQQVMISSNTDLKDE